MSILNMASDGNTRPISSTFSYSNNTNGGVTFTDNDVQDIVGVFLAFICINVV